MSVRVLSWVFERAPTVRGTDQLVLLAIASHARDDGGGAYPSITRLVRMPRLGRRAVLYSLARLQAGGLLDVAQDRPRGGVTYRVMMASTGARDALVTGARDAPVDGMTGARDAPALVHDVRATGARGAPNTSKNRPLNRPSIPPQPPGKGGGRARHELTDEQRAGIAAWNAQASHD